MNLETVKLKKQFQNKPQDLVATVIANNPAAVALAFKGYAGQIVNADSIEDMVNNLATLARMQPGQADELIYNILNVPIVEGNLTPVGKDFVLDEQITHDAMLKNSIYDPYVEQLNAEIGVGAGTSTSTDTDTNTSGSFSWGPIIQNALPGILAAFGITQAQNPASQAPPRSNTPTINWIWIVVALVVLVIIIMVIYRASK